MSIPTWPASLPQALNVEGYGEQAPNVMLRTSMDAGPAKVRRRFTAGPRPITGRQVMSTAQLATFETFFNDTLLGGSLRFAWTDPRSGAAVEYRFAEPPSWSALGGGWWQVDLPLEVLP